jgi:non-ribosomal peptide synthetase component F
MEAASVQAIFERQAQLTPQALALAGDDGGELSYHELNARANRLANYLHARGVAHGELVGVCLRRSPEAVIALLAILKAGGAYVPLDSGYPRERIAFILDDTRVGVIVTDCLCGHVRRMRRCADRWQQGSAARGRKARNRSGADDLIYVMYTRLDRAPEGRTSRTSWGGAARPRAEYAAFDAAQRFLLLSPLAFDAATFEIWGRCSTARRSSGARRGRRSRLRDYPTPRHGRLPYHGVGQPDGGHQIEGCADSADSDRRGGIAGHFRKAQGAGCDVILLRPTETDSPRRCG